MLTFEFFGSTMMARLKLCALRNDVETKTWKFPTDIQTNSVVQPIFTHKNILKILLSRASPNFLMTSFTACLFPAMKYERWSSWSSLHKARMFCFAATQKSVISLLFSTPPHIHIALLRSFFFKRNVLKQSRKNISRYKNPFVRNILFTSFLHWTLKLFEAKQRKSFLCPRPEKD